MYKLRLNENDFANDIFKYLNTRYIEELEKAAHERRLIYTGGMKETGKTTALIQFAKKYNYNVIVPDLTPVKMLREKFKYKNIFMKKFYKRPLIEVAVIDEKVRFTHDGDYPYPIITGFTDLPEIFDTERPDWWVDGDASTGLSCKHFIN